MLVTPDWQKERGSQPRPATFRGLSKTYIKAHQCPLIQDEIILKYPMS